MSDLQRAIAFAFQRKGARAMPRLDLHMILSMDMRWFAPEESKKVVARAIEVGFLVPEGDALRIAFDPAAIEVPLTFRPQARAALEEEIAPLAPSPVKAAMGEREAELERARRGGLVSLEVARLVVLRRAGEDVSGKLAEAEARVLKA